MNIKTITCHDVYNHGASLQAYALQTFLEELGHRVEIIDYKPPYLSGHFNLWGVNPRYNRPFIKQLYLLAKLPGRLRSRKRKKLFDQFTREYLHLTQRYSSFEELKNSPPEADVYVAGSDQIWNTSFQNGRDPAFYLDFVPNAKKRVSYAASFATPRIKEGYDSFVSRMISRIDCLSIRERASLPLLHSLGRENATSVVDPVFLLDTDYWKRFSSRGKRMKGSYLLVYDFEGSSIIRKIAQKIAEEKQLQIISVSPWRYKYALKSFVNVSPVDFISLLRKASYVISNSYHATAFSLIFHREFCVVKRTEKLNIRMSSLLDDMNLSERMVEEYSPALLNPIDYSKVDALLATEIYRSKAFIYDAIG